MNTVLAPPRRSAARLWAVIIAAFAVVASMLVVAPAAQATHFRADQISWEADATTANYVHFDMNISVRADYPGVGGVGTTFSEGTLDFGDGNSTGVTFTVQSVDSANNVATLDAHIMHQYGGSGPFTVEYYNCCRLSGPAHINNPDGDVVLQTVVDLAVADGSPTSLISPIIDCPIDAQCAFTIPAIHGTSGSTLNYRFATQAESGIAAQPGPPHATNAAVLSATGNYSWDTTGATLNPDTATDPDAPTFYSTQIVIEELVGGAVVASVPVDFFIRLTSSASANLPPAFDGATPADGATYSIPVGQSFSFDVSATDPNASDVVTLNALGVPADATFTTTPGNPATGTFTWTPTTEGQQEIVVLQAQDQFGLQATQRSITLTVVAAPTPPPPPAQCGEVGPNIPGALDHAVVGHTGNQSNFFRFASKNRVLTALFSAQETHGWCDVAILASSADYSDALAAAPLAEILDAPILLANADGTLDPQVREYLAQEFRYVIIASGPGVIPESTKNDLNDYLAHVGGPFWAGNNTVRIAGVNRYETAGTLAIASLLFSQEDWTSGTNFILADGRNFPDALSAGPAAAKVDNGVVLLTAGADGVPSFTAAFLLGHSISFSPQSLAWLPNSLPGVYIDWNNIGAFNHQSITVVGGAARAAADRGALGNITEPIEYDDSLVGADRYETATMVADKYFGPGVTYYTIASGQQFPDAIVAGGWAANVSGPLLLTRDSALPKVTKDYLLGAADNGDKFVVFGGTGSVSPAVSEDLAKTFVW